MILSTMNYQEIHKEMMEDGLNIMRWIQWQGKDIRRRSLKAKTFPFDVTFKHTSPRKNVWTVIFVVNKKMRGSDGEVWNVIYTSFRAPEGVIHLQLTPGINGQMYVNAFPPHFFRRYAERMNLELAGDALVEHFFRWNDAGYNIEKPEGEHEQCMCVRDGVCLGEVINDRTFVARTFIRYDMSIGWQREAFEKKRQKFAGEPNVMFVETNFAEKSVIRQTYKDRDREKDIFFHH